MGWYYVLPQKWIGFEFFIFINFYILRKNKYGFPPNKESYQKLEAYHNPIRIKPSVSICLVA